jgi:hypothetical protein
MRQTTETKVTRPWKKAGMSRASWYRHGKPVTKPERMTQAKAARILDGVSVRSLQRAARVAREYPDALPLIKSGKLTLNEVEAILRKRN